MFEFFKRKKKKSIFDRVEVVIEDKEKPSKEEHATREEKHKLLTKLTEEKKLYVEKIKPEHKEIIHKKIHEARHPIKKIVEKAKHPKKAEKKEWVRVGIPGFDELLEKGIPKGISTLVCGSAGTGKTIFCLQTLNYACASGEKCLYMSFEESEDRLRKHMHDFGWEPEKFEKEGKLVIKRFDPFDITRSVEEMLEEAKGELLIEATPVILPKGFKPDRIVVDSLSAVAAAFVGKEENYRIYIEQLFRYFEKLGATSFLIAETEQIPTKLTKSGVEEFLADGVIVLYNVRHGNIRESALEVLKLRGAEHQKKIVAMQILSGKGIVVYPEQEVFGGTESA